MTSLVVVRGQPGWMFQDGEGKWRHHATGPEFIRIGSIEFDLAALVDLEWRRAAAVSPQNPARGVRPMFTTCSGYGEELLALAAQGGLVGRSVGP